MFFIAYILIFATIIILLVLFVIMKIYYKDNKIEKLLSDRKNLVKKFGDQAADKIIMRMQELDAANTLIDLPPQTRPHPHEPKSKEIFSIDILKHQHPLRMLIKPSDEYDIENYITIVAVEVQRITKIHS